MINYRHLYATLFLGYALYYTGQGNEAAAWLAFAAFVYFDWKGTRELTNARLLKP